MPRARFDWRNPHHWLAIAAMVLTVEVGAVVAVVHLGGPAPATAISGVTTPNASSPAAPVTQAVGQRSAINSPPAIAVAPTRHRIRPLPTASPTSTPADTTPPATRVTVTRTITVAPPVATPAASTTPSGPPDPSASPTPTPTPTDTTTSPPASTPAP